MAGTVYGRQAHNATIVQRQMQNVSTALLMCGILGLGTACGPASSGTTSGPAAPSPSPEDLAAAARADSVRASYTKADVAFMQGMLRHHAQALAMARLAPTRSSSPAVQTLARRIIRSQLDEIALMSRWLREHDHPVPDLDELSHAGMDMDGGEAHEMHAGPALMPGMLGPAQMRRLRAARGEEWDRLFLTYMVQHHQGAVIMVDRLFETPGAGQADAIFKLAADIAADQSSEIDRMQRMLQELLFEGGNPS